MNSKSETLSQLAERERAMAKALSMSVLFNAEYYGNIVDILGQYKSRKIEEEKAIIAFNEECSKAGLDKTDQPWLWNYLKNYDPELARNSDAKWPACPDCKPYW